MAAIGRVVMRTAFQFNAGLPQLYLGHPAMQAQQPVHTDYQFISHVGKFPAADPYHG
jgi:hypothetical protein